jgi:hypothetical protein
MVLRYALGSNGQVHTEWGKIIGFTVALPSGWPQIEEEKLYQRV